MLAPLRRTSLAVAVVAVIASPLAAQQSGSLMGDLSGDAKVAGGNYLLPSATPPWSQ